MSDDDNLSGTQPPQTPQDAIAQLLQRGAANLLVMKGSDLNQSLPSVQYDPTTGQRYFDVTPVPVKRLMHTPLGEIGVFAQGTDKERRVNSGWGDTQANNTRNNGLDYAANPGEPVYAAGDGRVTFVGFVTKGATVQTQPVNQITSNTSSQSLLDANGSVVASVKQGNIGFEGIVVVITHSSDFAGYATIYSHLGSAAVSDGDPVSEGDVVGTAGTTGGPTGFWTGTPFLHFQADLTALGQIAPVNPVALVPNYWPSGPSTIGALGTAPSLPTLGLATVGLQVVSAMGLANTQALNRAVQLENQSIADIKNNHATYADLLAGRLQASQTALYAAVNAFKTGGLLVTSPMTFNFQTGLWSDNNQPL
jgi:murein DD-endopeptidase MepM/ murein hydrolase activator NlpD